MRGRSRRRHRLLEEYPLAGEAVDCRRIDVPVAVRPDPIGTRRVERDHDEIEVANRAACQEPPECCANAVLRECCWAGPAFGVYSCVIQNMLNSGAVTSVQARYPSTTTTDFDLNELTQYFGTPLRLQSSRQITFGLRWSF